MANTQAVCNSFKTELMKGLHAFGAAVVRGTTAKDVFTLLGVLSPDGTGAIDSIVEKTTIFKSQVDKNAQFGLSLDKTLVFQKTKSVNTEFVAVTSKTVKFQKSKSLSIKFN